MATAPAIEANAKGAWWTVAVLGTLYILSFVDRIILALLVQPLRADLGVSDVQLGLLFGPAFALFYAVLGLPMARFADRGNRKRLVFVGAVLWSVATIASAFATAYWQLVVLRVGLAIGEAALTPAAYSMIGDLFAPKKRALAASIYSAMGMAGSSGAYILGALAIRFSEHHAAAGHIALEPWRLVLLIVGVPALAAGLLHLFTIREPVRGGGGQAPPSMGDVMAYLRQHKRLFTGLFVGAGLTQAVGYSYAAWGPEVLRRQYGWSVDEAGLTLGLIGLLSGFSGTIFAPQAVRWLEKRGRMDAVAFASMAGLAIGTVLAAIAPLLDRAAMFLAVKAVASFCLVGGANNVLVAMQLLAPDRMRATLVALLLMSITFLGLGGGPTAAAVISSSIDASGQALGPALALLAVMVGGPALGFLWFARKPLVAVTKARIAAEAP